MVSKTRDKLIEVARQLFTYKGVENTTMNDIAAASDKGRRTIYTYFKSKREIFDAVVEKQSDFIINKLQTIVEDPEISPVEKLRKYLYARFDIIPDATPKFSKSRFLFGRDSKKIQKIYNLALVKERELLDRLLQLGVASGDFHQDRVADVKGALTLTYFAVDYFQSHQSFDTLSTNPMTLRDNVVNNTIFALIK